MLTKKDLHHFFYNIKSLFQLKQILRKNKIIAKSNFGRNSNSKMRLRIESNKIICFKIKLGFNFLSDVRP